MDNSGNRQSEEILPPYVERDDAPNIVAKTGRETAKADDGTLAAEHQEDDPRLRNAGKQSYHCYGIFEDN